MWRGNSIAVVLPTYNEKGSIADVIRGFEALGIVDEILVVNNNAAPGTSDEVAMTGAREVVETRQGYGAAIQRGLREVDADLICVCEPDGTFLPDDLHKLLVFSPECDFVLGSRTVSNFIWQGANMGWFLQWGNWAVAKLVEVLYNTSYLSDVGCTFRVMSRQRAEDILAKSSLDGSAYGLEMLLLAVSSRTRLVQVPVNYYPRVGVSAVTGELGQTIRLGLEMIGLVLKMRVRLGYSNRSPQAPPAQPLAPLADPDDAYRSPTVTLARRDPRRIAFPRLSRRR